MVVDLDNLQYLSPEDHAPKVYIATKAAFKDVRVDTMVALVDVAEKVMSAPPPGRRPG